LFAPAESETRGGRRRRTKRETSSRTPFSLSLSLPSEFHWLFLLALLFLRLPSVVDAAV